MIIDNKTQECPICNQSVFLMLRYPNYICVDCIEKYGTCTKESRKITFGNKSPLGGFISIVDDNVAEIHTCYVNNVKCYADEARFGGIVIQPVNE